MKPGAGHPEQVAADLVDLIVIGGGAIGLELGTFFSEIGSDVTVLEMLLQPARAAPVRARAAASTFVKTASTTNAIALSPIPHQIATALETRWAGRGRLRVRRMRSSMSRSK